MSIVRLTEMEMRIGCLVGSARHIESLQSARRDAHGKGADGGWTEHINGACGEMAAAKALNLYWPAHINNFKGPDLSGPGYDIQVRTRSQSHYDLLVRDDDNDEHFFVHVLGQAPEYEVVGMMKGRDAKRLEWRQNYGERPPAFFVPREALVPI
jgi:hypothetical protein